jgi:hypothetical protein
MGIQEMQLVNCNFSEFKLGIDENDGIKPKKDDKEEHFEQSKESALRFTHLGFHAQPTITPMRIAIQRGAINATSSVNTSKIVGRCKISNKAESKAISYTGILRGISTELANKEEVK